MYRWRARIPSRVIHKYGRRAETNLHLQSQRRRVDFMRAGVSRFGILVSSPLAEAVNVLAFVIYRRQEL